MVRKDAWWLALCMTACGPAIATDAAEICGEPGPLHVLPLDDDELALAGSVTRVGDRNYYAVGDALDEPPPSEFGINVLPIGGTLRLWSTGACGESPRQIAVGFSYAYEHARWPGSLVARESETQDLYALDPAGVAPPRLLLPGFTVPAFADSDLGDLGLVAEIGDDAGTLALQPFPATYEAAPPARVELVPDVTTRFGGAAARQTEAFGLTTTGDVVRVDLETLEPSVVAEGVDWFRASADGRFLVLMRSLDPDDPDALLATTIVDRDTGDETWVGDAVSSFSLGIGLVDVEIALDIVTDEGAVTRFVELATLTTHDVPGNLTFVTRIDATRVLGYTGDKAMIYDTSTGTTRLLFEGSARNSQHDDDALTVLDVGLDEELYRTSGGLWRAAFDGSEPQQIARRATRGYSLLEDGEVVTVLDVDDEFLGTLVYVDPQTLDEHRIDDRVFAARGNLVHPEAQQEYGEGTVAYAVRDGERSGVWLARPREE